MPPYLDRARARYTQVRGELEAIQQRAVSTGRDLDDDELHRSYELAGEGRALLAQIEAYEADEQRSAAVAAMAGQVLAPAGGGPGGDEQLGVGAAPLADVPGRVWAAPPALLPDDAGMAELFRAAVERRPMRLEVPLERVRTQTRAAVVLDDAGGSPAAGMSPAAPVATRSLASALTSVTVTGATALNYPVFPTEAGKAPTGEGLAKPEGVDPTGRSATPAVLARWKTVSNQTLTTYAGFQQLLGASLTSGVIRDENKLIVDTINATTGIQTYAAAAGESAQTSVLAAIGMVEDSDAPGGYDALVVNPADLPDVMSGAVANSQVDPQAALRLSVWGGAVFITSAMAAGTALACALRASCRWVVGQAPTTLVDPYTDMKTNQTTIRLEEMAALAVPVPSGIVKVTFAAA